MDGMHTCERCDGKYPVEDMIRKKYESLDMGLPGFVDGYLCARCYAGMVCTACGHFMNTASIHMVDWKDKHYCPACWIKLSAEKALPLDLVRDMKINEAVSDCLKRYAENKSLREARLHLKALLENEPAEIYKAWEERIKPQILWSYFRTYTPKRVRFEAREKYRKGDTLDMIGDWFEEIPFSKPEQVEAALLIGSVLAAEKNPPEILKLYALKERLLTI